MLGLYTMVLPQSALSSVHGIHNTVTLELETKVIEGWRRFHNYGERLYKGLLLVKITYLY